jgi:hypothetical protein
VLTDDGNRISDYHDEIKATKIALPATDGSYNTVGEFNYQIVVTNTGETPLTNIVIC